jgi:hypothetical protein
MSTKLVFTLPAGQSTLTLRGVSGTVTVTDLTISELPGEIFEQVLIAQISFESSYVAPQFGERSDAAVFGMSFSALAVPPISGPQFISSTFGVSFSSLYFVLNPLADVEETTSLYFEADAEQPSFLARMVSLARSWVAGPFEQIAPIYLAIPVAFVVQDKSPPVPVMFAIQDESPPVSVMFAIQDESPPVPVMFAIQDESPPVSVMFAIQDESPPVPVVTAVSSSL